MSLVLAASPATQLTHLGSLTWPASDHGAGGFSGLEVSGDGTRFIAISDKGLLVEGRMIRQAGRLTGLEHGPTIPLRDENGAPVRGLRADAEGLAVRDDGRRFVSFEGEHRVWAYLTTKAGAWLPRASGFRRLQGNSGLEALAIDAKGRLYTLPERSGQLTRPFPVWRYDAGQWTQPFAIRRDGNFLPVGADFGPDGRLYLLERSFSGFSFRSRIRRFALTDTAVIQEETLLTSAALRHDNLEGLAVWRDDSGAIRLTMISDDNFNALQRTQIVEYRLTE